MSLPRLSLVAVSTGNFLVAVCRLFIVVGSRAQVWLWLLIVVGSRAQLTTSIVVVPWALLGSASRWDLPGLGIKPVPPTLAGELFTIRERVCFYKDLLEDSHTRLFMVYG